MSERKLATAALNAVLRGDHPAADRALDELAAQHGMVGVTNALVAWCDTALKQIPAAVGPVTLEWIEHGTGRAHSNANRVRPAERWAGRLLAARAAGDRHTFIALVESVPPTCEAVGEHVGAMVQMAARIVQGARA